jgi:glycerol-3-phosphate dehydrogenase (NAD(P)+)
MSKLTELPHFLIVGAGSWGTALGVAINRAGNRVTMWSRNETLVHTIRDKRVNEQYLPDIFLDPDIDVTTDLAAAAATADYILLAVPSQQLRPTCISLSDLLPRNTPILLAAKGIERGSLLLMHEVVRSIMPNNPVMVLSGPNFAHEVAAGLPTATTIAGESRTITERLIYTIGGRYFRPYYSDDLVGVQIGGALKNVIAIACGIATGMQLGENARAALITRGLAEMQRLARVKGGRDETLAGLSGLGDLLLSCASRRSRNMSLGFSIGRGDKLADVLTPGQSGLTEGVVTAESVYQLSRQQGVSMPICVMVHEVLQGTVEVQSAVEQLLSRPPGSEEFY